MKVVRLLFTRLVTVSLAILIQILIFIVALFLLGGKFPALYIVFMIFSFIIVIWIGMKNDNPAYKLAWVTLILLVPLVGGIIYLLWGNKRLPRKTRIAAEHFSNTSLEYHVRDKKPLADLKEKDKMSVF